MTKKITGIILAGGKSSRMGCDKGLVNLHGKTFIAHILAALVPSVNEIIIIANNTNYNNLGYNVYEDIIKDCGPLGGIYTGLMNSRTENNFVVSCDIPFLNSGLIKYIIENRSIANISVPVYKGNREPLCGVYTKKTCSGIYNLLMSNELKIQTALKHFIIKEIYIEKTLGFYNDNLFMNINTPEELKKQLETADEIF